MRKGLCILLTLSGIFVAAVFVLHKVLGYQPKNPLSVTTFNVGTFNSEMPEMENISKILTENCLTDILLLQEVPGTDCTVSLAETLNYRFHVFAPYRSGNDGLSALSRYPIRMLKVFYFHGYAAMAVEADIGDEKFLLVCVHLERIQGIRITKEKIELSWQMAVSLLIKELTQETDRTQAVKQLLSWIASQSYRYVIVAGDFNTVPFSKTIRAINRRYEDTLWPSLAYFRGTYNESSLPIQPRIDYIFHSPALKCTSAGIIRESAGDHYPVRARIEVKAQD